MSQPGDEIWRFQAGTSYSHDYVYGVSADAEGSFFLAGTTEGSLDGITFNAGGTDMAAGKLDSDGTVLWYWQEGSTEDDSLADAAATDDGGVVFAGSYNGTLNGVASEGLGDFFAIKFDSDGTEEWRWQDGTEKDEVILTCSKTADGNVVLTGMTQGDWVETNTGLWALVAVKLDVTDGSVIWQYQAGVPSYSVVSRGAASRADGSIVIGGSTDGDWDGELTGYADFFSVALNEDGSELWRFQDGSEFSISSAWGVAALSDGSVVLAGVTDGDYAETNAGEQDFALVKLTEEGVLDWTWQDGTPYDDGFEGAATGIDGTSMVFVGYTYGTWAAEQAEDEEDSDAVGMSMDGDGTLLWTYQAGTTGFENFIGVDVSPDGAALLAGYSTGTWEDSTTDFYADFAGVLIATGAVPATPAPATVIAPSTPSPVTGTSGGTSEGSCGDGESFRITSDVLPVVQGCYQQTDWSFDEGDEYEEYTVSGMSGWEHIAILGMSSAFADDDGDVIMPFYLAFVSEEDDGTIVYCVSNEDAVTVHPVDATWTCDLGGTGTFEDVTDEEISMDCGCTGTPADSPVAPATLTPSVSPGESMSSSSSSSSSVPLGPLVGGIIGCLAFVALVVGIFVARRRARGDQSFGNAPARSKNYPAVAGRAGAAEGDIPPPPPPAYTEPPPPMADAGDIDLPPPPAYSEPPPPFSG